MARTLISHFIHTNRKFLFYFIIVAVSSFFLFLIENRITRTFERTSKIVLGQYDLRIDEYKKTLGLEKEELDQLAAILRSDSTQYAVLRSFLETKGSEKYSYDKATHLLEESKAVLEYQMSAVKTEYEALEIWVALLTIVFLVFSFYSFYRMDKMMEKGKSELDLIKQDAEDSITDFKEARDDYIDDMETKKIDYEQKIANAIKGVHASFGVLKEREREDFKAQTERLNTSLEEMKAKISERESKAENIIQELSTKVIDVPVRVSAVEKSVLDIQTLIDSFTKSKANIEQLQQSIEEIQMELNSRAKEDDIKDLEERVKSLEYYWDNYYWPHLM